MRIALLLSVAIVALAGCVRLPGVLAPADGSAIQDLKTLPQDPAFYAAQLGATAEKPLLDDAAQQAMNERFDALFFDPWRRTTAKTPAAEAFWGITDYAAQHGFGENKLPRSKAWMDALVAASDTARYPSLGYKAIAVRNTALRVMPTQRPFFLDFEKAGEGYPFDYFQGSFVWAGAPLFVAHSTPTGDWLFVETGATAGWVQANDLARVDDNVAKAYQTGAYAVLLKDEVLVREAAANRQGRALFTTHLGAVFPLPKENSRSDKGLEVLVPVADANGAAVLRRGLIPAGAATSKPLTLTAANVAAIAASMMGKTYGWAGLYENRDCSSTQRDLFSAFGVWLPRNSAAQAKTGRVIALKDMDVAAKERLILEQGVPFLTLLGLKGHIVLYLGAYQGRAAVFHNIWGVRTLDREKREGRRIIGRTVITTLEPGKEHEDVARAGRSLLHGVHSMTILGP